MFLPLGGLNGSIHLSADTELRKSIKAGITPHIVVPHRLKQANHPLLNQVFVIRTQNKHGFCFYYENGEDFTDDKAAKLKSFVEDNLNANEEVKFIIHCMQGKSRSAAVGSYIANKIGQFNDDFLSEYDIVYRTLLYNQSWFHL